MPTKGQRDPKAIEIGMRIAEARREAGGMSQRELADLIGVSERSVQAYEQGEVIPWRYVATLESVLGRPTAWILHGEDGMLGRDGELDEIRTLLRTVAEEVAAISARVEKNTARLREIRDELAEEAARHDGSKGL